jgi:hypothetical protein
MAAHQAPHLGFCDSTDGTPGVVLDVRALGGLCFHPHGKRRAEGSCPIPVVIMARLRVQS